jgi:hypothetical protein
LIFLNVVKKVVGCGYVLPDSWSDLLLADLPCRKQFSCVISGNAVRFLSFPGLAYAPSGNHFKMIAGNYSPQLLGTPFELFPVSFGAIPVHIGYH